MAGAALRAEWTLEAFLGWERLQSGKWEFVGGQPRAMGGGTDIHDSIAGNIRAFLKFKLKGSECRASGPDLKIITGLGTSRYPDALVNCAPRAKDVALNPAVVFEVLSDSTKAGDFGDKFDEYDATPAILQYVLVYRNRRKTRSFRGGI